MSDSNNNILAFPEDCNNRYNQNSNNIPEYERVVSHIENTSQHATIVKQAKGKAESKLAIWLKDTVNIFITSPSDLHGKAIVTQEARDEAKKVAVVTTASNLIDFVFNWSLFYFLFSNWGSLIAFPASFAVNMFLLRTANASAAGVPTSMKKNKDWSQAALFGLVTMNILQTAFSGVGSELFFNKPELRKMMAAELIAIEEQRVEGLREIVPPKLKEVARQCLEGQQILEKTPRNDPTWESKYIAINGKFSERERNWSGISHAQWPRCVLMRQLQQEQSLKYEQARAKLDKKTEASNDIAFLREEYPDIYIEAFTDDGELKSGADAVKLATISLFDKIKNFQLASLGLTLILLSLSIITSILSIKMMLAYVKRTDVQLSFDETLRIKRDKWLERQWQAMNAAHQEQLRQLESEWDF